MTKNKDDRVSVKIDEHLARELERAALDARSKVGRKPTYSQIIETAWNAFKGARPTVATDQDVEFALALLAWLRHPDDADKQPLCQFVLAEFERDRQRRSK